jgi:hypothetical protein
VLKEDLEVHGAYAPMADEVDRVNRAFGTRLVHADAESNVFAGDA